MTRYTAYCKKADGGRPCAGFNTRSCSCQWHNSPKHCYDTDNPSLPAAVKIVLEQARELCRMDGGPLTELDLERFERVLDIIEAA
jgi:hypothetical protein